MKKRSLVHSISGEEKIKFNPVLTTVLALIIIFAGISTGYILAGKKRDISGSGEEVTGRAKQIVGKVDKETFKDSAEGILKTGGINGEGTHKLIRQGGESQTVYLTSSVVDLDQFTGKKVKVWGETFAAEKAGWLMDVGLVEVLE